LFACFRLLSFGCVLVCESVCVGFTQHESRAEKKENEQDDYGSCANLSRFFLFDLLLHVEVEKVDIVFFFLNRL
jgi:hypothetical protein